MATQYVRTETYAFACLDIQDQAPNSRPGQQYHVIFKTLTASMVS